MRVLSLFDGISCGQVALERAGKTVSEYHAFEIDKHAIWITQKNYPNTIQHGDVFEDYFMGFGNVDLVMGGSPCTYWSKAKAHTAKIKREVDTTGIGWQLFERFALALRIAKPKYFLYENNYGIPEEIEESITKELDVNPILINSNLVSCQNRKRLYWTNIPGVNQPEDKGILVKDIMVNDPILIKTDERIKPIRTKNYVKYDLSGKGYFSQQDRAYFEEGKFPTVPRYRTDTKFNVWLGNQTYKKTCPAEVERMQTLPDNYTEGVPKTRRYEAIGNGWTVDVIAHILKGIEEG